MEIFFAEQWKNLAESCILGLIFGVGYDIIRVFHVLCGIGSYKVPARGIYPAWQTRDRRRFFLLYLAGDLVYMTFFTILTSVFFYYASHGRVRLFLVAGGLGGFLGYRYTIGRLFMGISEWLVCTLKKLWTILVWRPLVWCGKLLCTIGTYMGGRIWCLGKWLWRLGPGNLVQVSRRYMAHRRLHKCIKRLPKTMRFP